MSNYSVFVDFSALIDYCSVHLSQQSFAESILEAIYEDDGELIVREESGDIVKRQLRNRHEIFKYLRDKASSYLKNISEAESQYLKDILTFKEINQITSFDLTKDYRDDIGNLREKLRKDGLRKFRRELDNFLIQSEDYRLRLFGSDNYIPLIQNSYEPGGRDTFQVETCLLNYAENDPELKSLTYAAFWQYETQGTILVSPECAAFKHNEEVRRVLSKSNVAADLDLLSTKQAVAKSNLLTTVER